EQETPYKFSAGITTRPNYRYVYHCLFPVCTHPALRPPRRSLFPLEKKKGKAEGPSLITSSAPFTVLRIGSVAGPLFARISFAPWYENHESKGLLFLPPHARQDPSSQAL